MKLILLVHEPSVARFNLSVTALTAIPPSVVAKGIALAKNAPLKSAFHSRKPSFQINLDISTFLGSQFDAEYRFIASII